MLLPTGNVTFGESSLFEELDALLAERALLADLVGRLDVMDTDAQALLDALPEDLSPSEKR